MAPYGEAAPRRTIDYPAAIASHSAGFAAAADGNWDAPVEGCPGWTVTDLVRHLTEVQWFWATIVEQRLLEPPDDQARPPEPRSDQLLDVFRAGARRLVSVLQAVDPNTPCWTWAPSRHDAAFVIRHQAQEAAIHHWDAARAAGRTAPIEADVAADAVDEFLAVSVSSEEDPADPPRPALDGPMALSCTDQDMSWTVEDGSTAGTVVHHLGVDPGVPVISAPAAQLLLGLYRRVPLDTGAVAPELADRLRALTFTD